MNSMIIPAVVIPNNIDNIYTTDPVYIVEFWKPITNDIVYNVKPYYIISNYGRLFSKKSNKFINGGLTPNGYNTISLQTYDGHFCTSINRLVLLTFCPIENPDDYESNHIDCNRLNNKLNNLNWKTPIENSQYAMEYGNGLRAEDSPVSIYTNEDIELICSKLEDGWVPSEIAKLFPQYNFNNLCGAIRHIKNGYSWKSISSKYNINRINGFKFNDDQLSVICDGIMNRLDHETILNNINIYREDFTEEEFNLYMKTVSGIKNHKLYINYTKDMTFPTERSYQYFTNNQIHEICKMLEDGYTYDDIIIHFNIPENDITKIRNMLYSIKRRKSHTRISKNYNF